MKKLLFILLLFPVAVFSQVGASQITFNTLADLKLQSGTDRVQVTLNGLNSVNDFNGGTYMWDSLSVATPNNFTIVQVTGVTTGRWLRLGNANTIKGVATLSGGALQTAYTVNYVINGSQVTLPFTPITVIVQPRSSNAAVPSWVSSITTTGFTVNFSSVPILGTNNINIDYIVVKQ